MIRRTNEEIKSKLKKEYKSLHESGVGYLTISRALSPRYNPRLIIEAIQEYNDERFKNL